MTVSARLADGRILTFPDGTDPSVIQSTVKRILGEVAPKQNTSGLGDIATAFTSGAIGSTKALIDFAGAENVASKALGAKSKAVQAQYSPARQAEMQAQDARMKQAEASGSMFEEIKAGARSIAEAPLQTIAQGVGSFVPYVPAMLLGPVGAVLGLGARTVAALGAVANSAPKIMSTVQGIGAVKGSIYDTVYEKERESGVPEAEARAKAMAAQDYTGKNIDQMALAGLIGRVAGGSGIERLLTPKGAAGAAPGMARRVGRAALEESITEAPQGGQERLASNLALQREGYEVPTFQGVAGQATQEGLTGALAAGPIGAFRGPSSQPPTSGAVAGAPGSPTDIEAATQARRLQLQDEQRLASQGASSREGEKILDAEAQEAAVLAKEQEAAAQQTMQADYAQSRAAREAELKEAFPADYSDVMERTDRYGVLATELASLEPVRKTAEVRGRIQTIQQRMADIAAEDDRVPNEMLRMQGAQIAAARKAGFPAEKAAQVFAGTAPAQMEMREALPQGTLPSQVDLFGNPVQPTAPQTEGLQDVISAGLPATTDVLDAAGLAPTRRELEDAGQQRLGLRKTPAGQPTSPIRATAPVPATAISPLPVVESAPADLAQPDAITATEIRQFGTMSKANRQWLVNNIQGRTPQQVRDMVEADPTIMTSVPKGLQTVLKEVVAVATPKETPSVQPTSAVSTPAEPTIRGRRGKPGVGVPSELAPPGTVEPGAIADPSTGELAPADGRGLVPTGQPVSQRDALEVDGQPALDEAQRKADAAEVAAALAEVDKSDRARRAPSTTATFDQPTKATPKPAPEVEQATGSPFAILNRIADRQAKDNAKATPETKSPKNKGRASAAVAEGQSSGSLKTEIAKGKGVMASALRRAIASGNVVLETRHPDGGIGGYFDGTRVTLYADGIPAGQAMAVALHEVGAHMGFKRLFGERVYNNTIKRIQEIAAGKEKSQDRDIAQRALSRIPKEDIARGEEVYGDETLAYFIEEVLLAQQAGTLPNTGAVRSLLNNIRLAMLAAINRTFGSRLGVADFTSNDILSMAQGAFLRESFGATKPGEAAPSDAGRTSKTAETILGVDALDPAMQASIDAIQAAMPKLESSVSNNVIEQGLKGVADARKKSGIFTTFRQAMVDKFSTVESKVSQMFSQGVRDSFGNLNPMVLARQAEDSARIILDFFRTGGIELTKAGVVSTRQNDQSIASALTKVAALGRASNMTYEKAKEYVSTVFEGHRLASLRDYNNTLEQEAVSLEGLNQNKAADDKRGEKIVLHMTNAEINTLEAVYQKSKAVQNIQADLNATRTQAIDFMISTGRISAEQGGFWKENAAYVPFSRVFEDAPVSKVKRGGGLGVLRNIPEMKGSLGRPVQNVLDAYASRLGSMVEESMKNHAAVNLLSTMELGGYAKKLQGLEQATNKNLVVPKLYVDGKPVFFEVQNEYDLLAFQQAPEITNWLIKGLAATARVLRTSVTAMPPFALKQVIDDAQRAMFTSGVARPLVVGMKTLHNLPRTFFGELTGRKSPLVRQLEAAGVIGDFDSNMFQPTTELEAEIGAKKRGAGRQLLHRLEQFTKASDLSARLAVYEETLLDTGGKKQPDGDITGGDAVLAQTRARELINFSRRGTSRWMRGAAQVIPFFNAYAQGMDVLYRAASGIDSTSSVERSAARKLFLSRVALMSAMSTLYALSMSDDEGYKSASEDVRDNNWILPGGVKLPVPRELGFIFKSIPERTVEYYQRYGTAEEQSILQAIGGVSKVALAAYGSPNAIPALVRPILENMTNYSFFGQRALEPASVQGQEAGFRSTSSTSELAKALGESTNISPIKIDNLIRGMFGMMGATTLLATDALINPTRPDRPLYQMPFASIFLYDTIGGKAKTEFYDLRTKVATAVNTYNALETKDPEKAAAYGEKNAALLGAAPTVNSYLSQLNDLGRMRRLLEQGTEEALGMTGTERRKEIDEIRRAENELVSFVREMEADLRKL
jgi:hypothetical protein